ncbi:lipase/acylhydrolase [Enterococcus florum]|uniref:Lipase/acylhydrolase n=1 Tax=Enterococcus florum TaxID=2480627 RepID=A0A4P5P4R1_9ENTE|nr:SGNH/GDSL hydrolase family protein [Enterococcus florum]GCF92807.1 lipase/acylhydrolase [Enterococcus florum]
MKKIYVWLIPLVAAVISFAGLAFFIPKAQPRLKADPQTQNQHYKQTVHFVAVGDSLTQGVGDETDRGGFVPLVADSLRDEYSLSTVQTENYGVSGERSDQILKRLKKDTDLQRSLESSDMITLTVGGNDLLQAFQKNITATSAKKFDGSIKKYQKNVEKIIEKIRELNTQAPIYLVGIYNPYYLNFSDIKEMQEVVDNWNDASEELAKDSTNVFFVPVNDLLYKGLPTSDSTDESSGDQPTVKNNVLYDEDNFHPNNLGYQLMANAVRDEMIDTNELWLLKEENK